MATSRFSVEAVFKSVDRVTGPVKRMQAGVARFSRSATAGLKKVDHALGRVTNGLNRAAGFAFKTAAVGVGALGAAVLYTLNAFSKIENAEAYFTPLLGGAERAKEMVAALNKTAASTPFQFESLAGAAGQLLPVMNGDIERTIKTMRMLGDTAGGNAQKLDSITRGFTKAMLKGKVDMESLNMIAEAGVPIFDDLAAVMGVKTGEKFFEMISDGKVGTADLEKAFEKLTGEGGKFYKGMEISSMTLSGKWSTLMDNISLTAAGIGEVFAPEVKNLMDRVIGMAGEVLKWVTANQELLKGRFVEFVQRAKVEIMRLYDRFMEFNKTHDVLEMITSGLGTVVNAIIFLSNHGGKILAIVGAIYALMIGVKVLTAAMTVFNAVMALNPIALIAIGIAAAVAAGVALVVWIDDIVAGFEKLPGVIKFAFAPLYGLLKAIQFLKGGKIGDMLAGFIGDDSQDEKASADEKVARLNEIRAEKKRAANRPQVITQGQQMANAMTEHTERGIVDVNFNNAPKGTDIVNRSPVPGVTVKQGFSGAY